MKQYYKKTKTVKIEIIQDQNNEFWLFIWNTQHNNLTFRITIDQLTAIKIAEQNKLEIITISI